jgi:hypothetical protein
MVIVVMAYALVNLMAVLAEIGLCFSKACQGPQTYS